MDGECTFLVLYVKPLSTSILLPDTGRGYESLRSPATWGSQSGHAREKDSLVFSPILTGSVITYFYKYHQHYHLHSEIQLWG